MRVQCVTCELKKMEYKHQNLQKKKNFKVIAENNTINGSEHL